MWENRPLIPIINDSGEWFVGHDVGTDGHSVVAQCFSPDPGYKGKMTAAANARRIAAAWNACQGIPTHMLHPRLVLEMTETMDILLHIIDQLGNHVFQQMFSDALDDARDYVSRLRGEA